MTRYQSSKATLLYADFLASSDSSGSGSSSSKSPTLQRGKRIEIDG